MSSYNWSAEKCYISIFVLATIFLKILLYLTVVHNLGLAKVWLTQGLTVNRYIARSRCLWLMDLMIVQIIWILMWHECDIYCCSWLFSSYLIIRIFVKWLWKAQSAKETFVSEMLLWLNFHEADTFSLAILSSSGIHKSVLEGWSFWENCWIL